MDICAPEQYPIGHDAPEQYGQHPPARPLQHYTPKHYPDEHFLYITHRGIAHMDNTQPIITQPDSINSDIMHSDHTHTFHFCDTINKRSRHFEEKKIIRARHNRTNCHQAGLAMWSPRTKNGYMFCSLVK